SGGNNGVYGTTANQPYSGVVGEHTNNGKGVAGYTSGDGYGVWGSVPGASGVGVFAGNTGGGVALQVSGRTNFSRAGAGTVLNSSFKSVTVPGPISLSTWVVATLTQDLPDVFVRAAVPDPANSAIVIYLNKVVSSATFAFLILN